jgi:RND superfamily putative drug exporter
VVFIIILLLLIFRAALAPLITLVPAFIAITIAGPLVAEAAQAGLKVSQLAQILLIVLVLGAGTDYGLFLVFRVREQLRGGMEPREAVITSLTRVGESITFSAATVIAALLAGLTLLPALLAIFGRAAFWPSKTREGTGKRGGTGPGRGAHHAASCDHPGHRAGHLRRPGRGLARVQGRRLRR